MPERWRLLKCESHGIQLGPKMTLRCEVAEDGPNGIIHCEKMLDIIEVEEVRWPFGEPPPAALEVLVNLRAEGIEEGLHRLNEASRDQLREWIRPSAEEELTLLLGILRAGWTKRAEEAQHEVGTVLGLLRAGDAQGEDIDAIPYLQRALDRLRRINQGEDYIEKSEALRDETGGAFHFTAPAAEALPADVRDGSASV